MTTAVLTPVQTSAPAERYPEVLEIVVTHEDIRKGKQNDANACAVALSLRRQGYAYVEALPHRGVYVADGPPPHQAHYASSDALRKWIEYFDLGCEMAPERFKLKRVDGTDPAGRKE